jgi:hypothetical protein
MTPLLMFVVIESTLADGFTACSARGDLTARIGKSVYGLRP